MYKSKIFMIVFSTLIVGKAIASVPNFEIGKAIDRAIRELPVFVPKIAENGLKGASLVLGNTKELHDALTQINNAREAKRKEPTKADILAIRDIFKIVIVGFLGTTENPGIANSLAEYSVAIVGAGLGQTEAEIKKAKENIKILSTLLIQSLQLIDMLLPLMPEDSK